MGHERVTSVHRESEEVPPPGVIGGGLLSLRPHSYLSYNSVLNDGV